MMTLKIWHVQIREENPNPLSSGIIEELTILAETFDKALEKARPSLEAWDDSFIGKIEYVDEVDVT